MTTLTWGMNMIPKFGLKRDAVFIGAEACFRKITIFASTKGLSIGELVERVPEFRRLNPQERNRAVALLHRMPLLSSTTNMEYRVTRFYLRSLAPKGAANVRTNPITLEKGNSQRSIAKLK